MSAPVLSGIDHVELHRHVAEALFDFLTHLDDDQARHRCDHDRPCCDHAAGIEALAEARRALAQLHTFNGALGRVVDLLRVPRRVRRLVDNQTDLLEGLDRQLDAVEHDVALACTHACPGIPRDWARLAAAADDVVDRLEGHGYQFAKPPRGARWQVVPS